ncbi:hypothetical protein pdam_00009003 [Pocillopora damicornis]|uniref:Integrase p58-like C-terminal domain-containing protein n=1 Tax=Pocillopora damicornis TaxID=46731 RepID=A0A3M6T666_POCDA|nr:hypothetical protein pdam_00009003 [Pocillopora damicornis]
MSHQSHRIHLGLIERVVRCFKLGPAFSRLQDRCNIPTHNALGIFGIQKATAFILRHGINKLAEHVHVADMGFFLLWQPLSPDPNAFRNNTFHASSIVEIRGFRQLYFVEALSSPCLALAVKAAIRQKWNYDKRLAGRSFTVGDSVWLHLVRRKKGRNAKLDCPWQGPYLVISVLSDVVYRIQKSKNAKPKVVHSDRLKPYLGPPLEKWIPKRLVQLSKEGEEGREASDVDSPNVMLVRTSGVEVFLVGRKRIPQAVICARAFLGNVQLVIGLKRCLRFHSSAFLTSRVSQQCSFSERVSLGKH